MSEHVDLSKLAGMDARAKRELLSQLLREAAGAANDPFKLSLGQEALWFLHELAPENAAYNVAFCVRLRADVNYERLERSIRTLIERHPMLRSTLGLDTNGLEQHVGPVSERPLEVVGSFNWNEEELALRVDTFYRRPFDLIRGPLFRCTLFLRSDTHHILLISAHHIVFDAWSLGIVLSDLTLIYEGADPGSLQPPGSYADYVRWQRTMIESEEGLEAWRYWSSRLSNLPSIDLHTDHRRPTVQNFRGATFDFALPASVAMQIRALAQAENATTYTVLVTAFHAFLHRYTGAPEVPIGTPLIGRSRPEFENIVGYFVNPVVVCAPIETGTTFRQHLAAMREVTIEAQRYGDFPFPELVKRLQPEREPSRMPLFQVMLNLIKTAHVGSGGEVLQPHTSTPLQLGSLAVEAYPLSQQEGQFDLDLTLLDTGSAMPASLKYSTDLYEAATIERMTGHFINILSAGILTPDRPIAELPMLSGPECERLLANAQGPQVAYSSDLCVHNLFEQQAAATPRVVAVICRRDQATYEDLDRRANRLANYLRSLGVGPEVLVGVCLERSIDLVVVLLGIMKAGGAYVPLDPRYPPDRVAFMLDDSGARVLVTEQQFLLNLSTTMTKVVCFDRDRNLIERQSSAVPSSGLKQNNLMYVIYTSGSTGKPKGVQITHKSVVNFLASMRSEPGICESDRLLAVTTISFDIAGLEVYLPLTSGANVILATTDIVGDGIALAGLIKKSRPTLMQATPATWRMLLESGWTGFDGLKILCGGEALSRELANRLLTVGGEVWNLYGPTETTIWSAVHKVDNRESAVPIGRPIANTACYLLDAVGQPVPVGTPGELFIGGDGVARGYLNRPELTAEKFVPSPFDSDLRLYRTGDLAVYLPDGNIEFLRRIDNQIKLRGFRIELGEIEAALEEQPGVCQAVVVIREDVAGDPRLAAYVTAREGEEVNTEELRYALATKIPAYMVPSAFMVLNAFPLTNNRKVDRHALPVPDDHLYPHEDYVPPGTAMECRVAEIFEDLLGIERVDIMENFFELGGHSLLAARLQRRLRERFGKELALMELLERPTVAAIADLLGAADSVAPEHAPWQCLVPVQRRGTRAPLFLACGYGNDVNETPLILARLAAHFDGDQPVYGLRPRWVRGGASGYLSIAEMARECLSEMRTVQPAGPYLVGGYCFAGSVAIEIAQQLLREGEDVRLLALIDSLRPNALHTFLVNLINYGGYLRRRGQHIGEVLRGLLIARGGSRKARLSELMARKLENLRSQSGSNGLLSSRDLFEHHRQLLLRYRPEPFMGPIGLYVCEKWYDSIVASKWRRLFERYLGWQGIARGGLSVYKVSGDHHALLTVHSDELARFLADGINAALSGASEKKVGLVS
ncbi:non-ribosomal peptide synthetase [Tunturiibacter psychrotolerans]|uniref:non-ribosomal peptide synthetase n=1 Tax=Tunturiibacter psychrotolerans TaxID=3069686 RepID=UPI003D1F09BF